MNYSVFSYGLYVQYLFNSDQKLQPYGKIRLGGGSLGLEEARTSISALSGARFDLGVGGGAMYVFGRHFALSGELMYQRGSVESIEMDMEELTSDVLVMPRIRAQVGLHLMAF